MIQQRWISITESEVTFKTFERLPQFGEVPRLLPLPSCPLWSSYYEYRLRILRRNVLRRTSEFTV
jgi:hypothetical protein